MTERVYDLASNYERALSRDQIWEINDINFLISEQERCELEEVYIRTSLEFPDDSDDVAWFRKARGALISYRVALKLIEIRLKIVRREKQRMRQEEKRAEDAHDQD